MSNDEKAGYNRFLLLVAGLGGLLYGVDVGIIAGALPYLEATSGLNAGQLSIVVAAVPAPAPTNQSRVAQSRAYQLGDWRALGNDRRFAARAHATWEAKP